MTTSPTERFTDRVDDYKQYRPRYPAAIIDLLARDCNLSRDAKIADVAAGTGLLAEIFLDVWMLGWINKDDAVLIEKPVVTFQNNLEVTLGLERNPSAAV